MKDFISIRDFSPQQIRRLIEIALHIKATPHAYAYSLKGRKLAMIFEKPSLRTRVSFDVAMYELGGHSLYLSPAEISIGKRESIHDVAKNLERMVDGIIIRTFSHGSVEELARHAEIPVINGLTDYSHPCQAIGDFLTILEVKGKFQGLRIAYVGDGNNVAHSLMFAGVQLGADVCVATPLGYEPDAKAFQWAKERAMTTGARCTLTRDPLEAVHDADVVYTDVWASMGQEGEADDREKIFRPYQVNAEMFRHANNHAIFMHCLPAHRGKEVTDEVIDSPRSVVFQQAENRLHAEKAILLQLMKQTEDRPSIDSHYEEIVSTR